MSDLSAAEILDGAELILWHLRQHVGYEDNDGYTCDERGCAVCNAGPEAIAADWVAVWLGGAPAWWDDDDPDVPHARAWFRQYTELPEDDRWAEEAAW